MHHSQVAIQADAAQETNADVDVLVEQEAAELTQPLSVAPVVTLNQHIHTHTGRGHRRESYWMHVLILKSVSHFGSRVVVPYLKEIL